MKDSAVPRLLIIDDLFGRLHLERRNEERANLCGQYLLEDITGDEVGKGSSQKVKNPVAQAYFFRGQRPLCSNLGDVVENDLKGTLQVIRSGWDDCPPGQIRWAMVLLDLCFYTGRVTPESDRRTMGMPEGRDGDDDAGHYFGLQILQAIHNQFPELPVVILSSKPRGEVSREFAYHGAVGFLPREDARSPEVLRELVLRHGLVPDERNEIVGSSKSILLALRAARRAAFGRQNVLIRGERGTGKELVASYIHHHGQRQKSARMIIVNSPNLSPTLYASLLFGIEKGVATDVDQREGKIRLADGGDLFFDEIGDLLPEVQSGLLRVLEQREITPVGSRVSYPVDIRFLSATNMDIEAKSAAGAFRSDLLDRLREGGAVLLPPLRERLEDIPLLVEKFVREAESLNSVAIRRQIEPEALEKIVSYDWPGNIRQLRSVIFNAVNSYPDVEHFVPAHLQFPAKTTQPQNRLPAATEERAARATPGRLEVGSLEELVEALDSYTFDPAKPDQLVGKLTQIEGAYARLLARYLKASLEATSQPTPDHPAGEIRIHPAVKLMKGDANLLATKAADIIKRILGIDSKAVSSLLVDPVLRNAYETALRLRPRQLKAGRKRSSDSEV